MFKFNYECFTFHILTPVSTDKPWLIQSYIYHKLCARSSSSHTLCTVTTCKKCKVIENINQSLQTIIARRCSTIYLRDRFSFLRTYQMFVPSAAVLPPDDAQLLHLLSGNTRGHGPILIIFGLAHHIIILMSFSCHRGTDKKHILLYTCTALRAVLCQKLSEHTHTHTHNERRCQILTLFSVKFRAAVPTEAGVSAGSLIAAILRSHL